PPPAGMAAKAAGEFNVYLNTASNMAIKSLYPSATSVVSMLSTFLTSADFSVPGRSPSTDEALPSPLWATWPAGDIIQRANSSAALGCLALALIEINDGAAVMTSR